MASYLITGASRGIGAAVVSQLVSQGHSVYAVVRSAAPAGLAGVVELDLADHAAFGPALRPFLAAVPALDGVVHCAGIVRPGRLADQPAQDFSDQFAVNVTAVAELTRHLLPALRAAAGTVVLVNSGSGLNARAPLASYAATKFALRGYADALRLDEPSIRVSTIYPGRTDTGMQRVVRSAEAGEYRPSDYLQASTVAGVIVTVLALPADATVTELTLRPTAPSGPAA